MDRYTFFQTFFQAIARDSDLDNWAQANFGRSVTVYTGLDSEAQPDADEPGDTPFIILGQPAKRAAQDVRHVIWDLFAWLVINTTSVKQTADTNLHEPHGVKLILDFISKTQAAVVAAMPANWSLAVDDDADTIGMLPEVHGNMDFTFTQRLVIGEDTLT